MAAALPHEENRRVDAWVAQAHEETTSSVSSSSWTLMKRAILSACLKAVPAWGKVKERVVEMETKKLVGDPWESMVTLEDFHVQNLLGGMTNELFTCSLVSERMQTLSDDTQQYPQIVARLLSTDMEEAFDRDKETRLIEYIAEHTTIAPQVLGKMTAQEFQSTLVCMQKSQDSKEGGAPKAKKNENALRFEEFIDGQTVTRSEFIREPVFKDIAAAFAQLHALQISELERVPMLDSLLETYARLAGVDRPDLYASYPKEYRQLLERLPWRQEIEYVKDLAKKKGGPIILCHNDNQEGNWIKYKRRNKKENILKLYLIDYEYSGYNYRGFEFANLFNEFTICYEEAFPGFTIIPEDFPEDETMKTFLRYYINSFDGKAAESNISKLPLDCQSSASEALRGLDSDSVLWETKALLPASHLLWALWSFVMYRAKIGFDDDRVEDPTFSQLQYGHARANMYEQTKRSTVS